jgi:membrane protein
VATSTRATVSPWKLGGLSPVELGRRVYDEFWKDEVLDRAAALSYYFLFALFPMLLFLTALLGLLPIPNLMDRLMEYVSRVLPGDSTSIVEKTLREITRGASGGFLSVGAVAALWASSSGMASLMAALNVAYDAEDRRPWWTRRLIAVVLTVVFSIFTLCGLLLLVFGGQIGTAVANYVGLGAIFTMTWNIARWVVAVVVVAGGISLIYYLAPAVDQPWYWVTPGSAFALAGWLLASFGLQRYVAYFGNYNATYGSIGGVILLLLWFYLTDVILLSGAEINAEIEKAARDRGRRLATAKEDLAA